MSSSWYEISADGSDHVLNVSIYGNFCANGIMHLSRDFSSRTRTLPPDYVMLVDLRQMIDLLGEAADATMAKLLRLPKPETRLAIVASTRRSISTRMKGLNRSNAQVFADRAVAMEWLLDADGRASIAS